MMRLSRFFLYLLVAGCLMCVLPALAQAPIGGDQGYFAITSAPSGASVIFDATPRGTTPVTVAVYTTGTPRHTLEVSMPGYQTWEQSIDMNPGAGMTIPIQVTLQQVQPTQPPVIGGDQGWYNVYCNVNGAQVMFDTQVVGVITNGVLTVPVYTTGTPYRTYTVTSPGYTTFTGTINAVPAAGQTLDLYATLNPAPTPTKGPFSPLAAVLALAGLALFVAMRRQ